MGDVEKVSHANTKMLTLAPDANLSMFAQINFEEATLTATLAMYHMKRDHSVLIYLPKKEKY